MDRDIETFLTALQAVAELVSLPSEVAAVVAADPDDDIVVATAIGGKVEVLATLDQHLQHVDVRTYCSLHGIRVMTDVELLQELRNLKSQPPAES